MGQPGCTHTEIAHTLGNGDKTQHPARDYEGELAAAAAAPPPLLLLLLLLHDPRCIAVHKPSQQTVSRFVFFGTHAEASNGTTAAAAAAAVAVVGSATGEAKTYVRVYWYLRTWYHILEYYVSG